MSGGCINSSSVCDGYNDCADSSDELDCMKLGDSGKRQLCNKLNQWKPTDSILGISGPYLYILTL